MSDFLASTLSQSDVGVVIMRGDLNGSAGDGLMEAYADATSANPPVVVLDFSAVDYINSTGIALIVGILGQARQQNREVRAAGLTPHYREVFTLTRLSDFMTFHESQESAVLGDPTPA